MGLDVYRGEAQEKIDGQQDIEKLAVAAMPYQEHAHRAHSGMTAGEGGRRTFSRRLGVFHELVEDSVGVSRGRKAVLVMAENMPDGKAYKPEDVYTSASGLTVEVINTDAEGRMGLADGLWYASAKLKAKRVIDIATLTGAVIMALGHEFAGLFCDDDKMADDLLKAGNDSGERLWRLPMCEEFGKLLKSDVADVKHLAARGHGAGSATAAMFLKKFVKGKTPWAHLDIAGRDDSSTSRPLEPKGATAFGIRLLVSYLKNLKL